MGNSLSLAAYLAWSAGAAAFAERKLQSRLAEGKEDPDRLPERQGVASLPRPEGPLVWFHCASVGESLSVVDLIRRLLDEREPLSILLTTGTTTSAGLMDKRLPDGAIHQFVPLDAGPFVDRFLDHWKPDLAVWVESELWPTLMDRTHKRGVPMVLLNARMSDESYRKWRLMRGAAGSLLNRFDTILAQDDHTARHLNRLGAKPWRVRVTGTLKEGAAPLPCDEAERSRFAGQLAGRPTWLAASTHPGEEDMAARAHRSARRGAHRLLMILAPRHPERGAEIAAALRLDGWNVAQRSKDEPLGEDTEIYLADTLGEMGLWYRVCSVSFVGGSLVPIGGHNPFEPASLGSAILSGPHTDNFRDISERLIAAGAMRIVEDDTQLGQHLDAALAPDEAARMAHAAWQVISDGAEVTDQAVKTLLGALDNEGT